jgi:hypothetical protein
LFKVVVETWQHKISIVPIPRLAQVSHHNTEKVSSAKFGFKVFKSANLWGMRCKQINLELLYKVNQIKLPMVFKVCLLAENS